VSDLSDKTDERTTLTRRTKKRGMDPGTRVKLTRKGLSVIRRRTLEDLCWGFLQKSHRHGDLLGKTSSRTLEKNERLQSRRPEGNP